ncbi:MAG: hypothetical protein RIE86_15190 [Imperialibacter sp.]|uniref:hypothetical protein n=1 Tax=Imperialibacter sp. TaxID=2038411 RepID=UPI0032EE34FB
MNLKNLILIWPLAFLLVGTLQAQTNWPLRQFRKAQPTAELMPYAMDQLWGFGKPGSRGIYSQSQAAVVVPPAYDLVLPTMEKDLFYVVRGDFAGLYAANGGELVPPDQFQNFRIFTNSEGKLIAENAVEVRSEGAGYATTSVKKVAFSLLRLADSAWRAVEIKPAFWLSEDLNRREDRIERYAKGQWIHHHALLEIKLVDMPGFVEPGTQVTKVVQESSIITTGNAGYLIPPRFVYILPQDTYLEVGVVKPLAHEPSQSSVYTKKGVYSMAFKEVIPPTSGSVFPTEPTGFAVYDNPSLSIFDTEGVKLGEITGFEQSIDHIALIGDKVYIACFSQDEEQLEMSIFDQHIYKLTGDFLGSFPFTFLFVPKNGTIASIEKIDPTTPFGLAYGLFDLQASQWVSDPTYSRVIQPHFRETLSPWENGKCSYYFDLSKAETHDYFDCEGQPINGVAATVSGSTYKIITAEEDASMAFHEPATAPFEFSHVLISVEEEMDFEQGMAVVKEAEKSGLVIYKAYLAYNDTSKYGLGYSDEDHLLLAPVFDSIQFIDATEEINLTYRGEVYKFPLSRYQR